MASVEQRQERYAEAIRSVAIASNEQLRDLVEAVMAVADAEQAGLRDEVYAKGYQVAREHWKGRADAAESEARRLVDWSNELAMLLPEDAETWPGVNPEGAQESIITKCLTHLLGEVERLNAQADEWADTADRWTHRAAENGRRAEAAEADLRALREGLEALANEAFWVGEPEGYVVPMSKVRALLAPSPAEGTGEAVCAKDVGDPPEVCRCLLPRGHAGLHECKHKRPAPVVTPSAEDGQS